VGTNEMALNAIPVKNLATGEQTTLDFEGILAAVKGH
jgi:histidyl-tRNA synthetase